MTRPRPARVPLRVRLVASVVVLVALGLLVSGLAATTLLRSYLQDRLDGELRAAAAALVGDGDRPGPLGRGGPRGGPGALNRFYVQVRAADGSVTAELGVDGPPPALPADPTPGRPVTTAATDGDERWRVLVVPVAPGGQVALGAPLGQVDAPVTRLLAIEAGVSLVVLTALAGAAYAVVRSSLRPLDDVERTAAAIAGGDLTRRVPREDDRTEVGRLARAFNAMIGRIEGAFGEQRASEDRLRRFVADASHELRTPLTSIRGFAELHRAGAVPAGPELSRVMGRIEAEATRMGQLVEEMLLLARLDEHRPLERTPVDLLALASDAVHDARAADPGRPVDLQVSGDAAVVLGDPDRLRQVLVNLLGNALAHTPAGTAVHVRVGAADGLARVEVADEGPGLEPEQADRVFERFYRADPARSRAAGRAGGSGLGLSIVQAAVEAHDGRVGVRSTPGQGATFVVELPLAG